MVNGRNYKLFSGPVWEDDPPSLFKGISMESFIGQLFELLIVLIADSWLTPKEIVCTAFVLTA